MFQRNKFAFTFLPMTISPPFLHKCSERCAAALALRHLVFCVKQPKASEPVENCP